MMLEMSSTSWLRRGSSVVFDKQSLGPLIAGGCMVSLRQAFSWLSAWPSGPPCDADTVLVCGLETCLEVLSSDDAERFLQSRVKPFILEFQSRWDQRGLVFGFGTPERSFEVTPADEEVRFRTRGSEPIRLSQALWDGSATLNVTRLVRSDSQGGGQVTVGFHVPRIS